MKRKPQFYSTFKTLSTVFVLLLIGRGILFALQYNTTRQLSNIQENLKKEKEKLDAIHDTSSYQKIAFVEKMQKEQKKLPRSTHIGKLIDVLKNIQSIDNQNKLELYDFKVNLDTIEISGKAKNLTQLYAPDTARQEGLIGVISKLKFLKDIRIQHYEKGEEDNMYEFTLYATILLNENN